MCTLGSGPDDLRERTVIPTGTPEETLPRVARYFERHRHSLDAVGVASFGPVDLASGRIGATPKIAWRGVDLLGAVRGAAGGLPVGFDTDVNAAALAERRWGAARGLDTFVYVTIGTGVGGGGMAGGQLLHGLGHPEMGHLRIPRSAADPLSRGSCPFHPDCWEGWTSRAAIERRWGTGVQASDVTAPGDRALLAHYIAAGVVDITCVLSPQRVILGGGVVLGGGRAEHRDALLALVRGETVRILNGYLPAVAGTIETYIVAAELGEDAGPLGGIILAGQAAAAS